MQQSSSDDRGQSQKVVTCSATVKPAPTIQWNSTEESSVITVQNDDNTFTTTSNLTLQLSSISAGHMDCLVNNVRHRIEILELKEGEREVDSGKYLFILLSGFRYNDLLQNCIAVLTY